jgi:rRNA maturation RNase YbeY
MPETPDETAANLILALAVEPPDLSLSELFGLSDEQIVDVLVRALAQLGIAEPVEISVLVTTDAGLRDLNRTYRSQDQATDVLSFPAQTTPLVSAPADELWQRPIAEPAPGMKGSGGAGGMAEPGANGAAPHEPADLVDLLDEDDLADLEDIDDGGELDELDEFDELDLEELDDLEDVEDGEESDDDLDEVDDLEELEAQALDLGDIALSYEAVRRQAAAAGHSAGWECAYLLVHGVLHLAGYDDQTEAGYAAMTALQESVLASTNIAK